jgi:hypothetical protein
MSLFKKRHRHEMRELGKYYHAYESLHGNPALVYLDNSNNYGIHVELNTLKYCIICGVREIENCNERSFTGSSASAEYQDYIEELEATGVISDSRMEEKYEAMLNYIKSVNQF